MQTPFHIQFSETNGSLHIQPEGDFDGASAWELVNLLHDRYKGQSAVVIDTSRLRQVHPFGCATFKCHLDRNRVPAERLCFEGDKGTAIAPDGSKVITGEPSRICQCNGRCAQCKCAGHLKAH